MARKFKQMNIDKSPSPREAQPSLKPNVKPKYRPDSNIDRTLLNWQVRLGGNVVIDNKPLII